MKKLFFTIVVILPVVVHAQNIDINILKQINLNRNKHLDNTFQFITHSAFPVSACLPVFLYGIGLVQKDSITKHRAVYIGASVLSAAIVSTIIKYSVNRPRPFITYPNIENVTSGSSPAFPSGHTSNAFGLAASLSIAYPKWYVIAPSFAWASAVGYSRMDLGVHYPSDILMGAFVGAGSAYLCYKAQQWIHKKRKK